MMKGKLLLLLLLAVALCSAAAYSKEGPVGNTWTDKDCYMVTLCNAANNGRLPVVQELVAKGGDSRGNLNVDEQDKYGYTALWMVAMEGHASVVDALLARGGGPYRRPTVRAACGSVSCLEGAGVVMLAGAAGVVAARVVERGGGGGDRCGEVVL